MTKNANIGQAFPLESLGSDIVRNDFNYQSILNGLVEWDKTENDQVIIRLTKDTDPFFQDYIIPSKKAASNSLDSDTVGIVNGTIGASSYSSASQIDKVLYGGNHIYNGFRWFVDTNDTGDNITFRLNVKNNGSSEWELHYIPLASTWNQDDEFRYKNIVLFNSKVYRVDGLVTEADSLTEFTMYDNALDRIIIETNTHNVLSGDTVIVSGTSIYDGTYVVNDVSSNIINLQASSLPTALPLISTLSEINYKGIAVTESAHGLIVGDTVKITNSNNFDGVYTITEVSSTDSFTFQLGYNTNNEVGSFTVYKTEMDGLVYSPNLDPENNNAYTEVGDIALEPSIVPTSTSFTSSVIYKWQLDVDVAGFIIKNVSEVDSSSDTDINVDISYKVRGNDSIYEKSVAVHSGVNYAMYPVDQNSVWDSNTKYSTNENIAYGDRQEYTAAMIFNHADNDTKTINFINYEGPDLENGLAIYLPVEVDTGNGNFACPEDGYTYEFYFRLWANPVYTDGITRDHIINKSHIHIYNSATYDDALIDDCNKLIAKFSMARMTNTYIFGENISIPDKPVVYRATFVYSKHHNEWLCMDYYQLPDHVFTGPVGFIDPANPANKDLSDEMNGDILPNASHIGYESAAFPTFNDVFSGVDLNPVRLSNDDYLAFKNRIL